MLEPKRVKYRKRHRQRPSKNLAKGNYKVEFGDFGLKAISSGWISNRAIEAARRVMIRYLRKGGKMWIRIFPHEQTTYHGEMNKMGGGKGAPNKIVSNVKLGNILFEVAGISPEKAMEALKRASYKLRVKTKVIEKL
jgi:large subunit ribosomal protein L16